MGVDYGKRKLWKKAMAFLMASALTVGTVSVPVFGDVEDGMLVTETAQSKTGEVVQEQMKPEKREVTEEQPETELPKEVQSPILMSESSVSATEATAGDEITYRIKIDGEVVNDNLRVGIWYPESGRTKELYMTPEGNGLYTGTVMVSDYEGNGTLSVLEIGIWKGDQYEYYYNTKLAEEAETQRINMDKLDVKLSGCGLDVDTPVIDWTKCSITPEVLDGPGTVTLSIPVSDKGSGIPEKCGMMYFYNEKIDRTAYFDMNYDANTGMAVGTEQFSLYGGNGTWTMNSVSICDNAGNYAADPEQMPSFETQNLEEDFEPPVIDLKNIRIEPAELRPYEPVTVTIPVEDKSGIQSADCFMGLEGDMESDSYVRVTYDEEQKALIGNFSVDSDYGKNNQKYVLKSLWCRDGAENEVWYFDSELAEECPAFAITQGFIEDSVGPEIDLSTLNIDPVHVTADTMQKIRVKITDTCGDGEEISGVNYGECVIACPDGSEKTIFMPRFWNEQDVYLSTQEYTNYGINGRYVIKKVVAYDYAGNMTEAIPENVYYEVEGLEKDTEAPEVDIETLKVTPKEAGPYAQIQVQVKASDNKEMGYSSVQFEQPDGTIENYDLQYDSETQLLTSTILLGNFAKNGIWKLYSLSISDKAGNNTYYWKGDLEKEYTVMVSGMNEDSTAPQPDLSQIKFSLKTIHPGDTLKIEMPVVEESDISYAYVRLTSEESGRICSVSLYPIGSGKNKVLLGTMNFSDENVRENGRWNVSEICVSDNRGNVYQETPEELFVTFEGFGHNSEKAKILYEQMSMDKTLVKPGDVLKVTIPVENVDRMYGDCVFQGDNNEILQTQLYLNEDKTAVSGELEMRGSYGYNTNWELKSVSLRDGIFYSNKVPEKKLSFTTEGFKEFKEKEEELDYAGITITPRNIQQKQKVMVRIPLKNPDNVLGGGIWLATKGDLATKYTVLKKNKNALEGVFEFNGYEANTEWKISDMFYNVWLMDNHRYCDVDVKKHPELGAIVVTTANMTTDHTPPVLESGSVAVHSKTPVPGGKVELALRAFDNLSGISEVTVEYNHRGDRMVYEMEKKGEDSYSLTIPLSEYGYDGVYRLSRVTLYDHAGNSVYYENYKYDLTGGDFEVSNFKPDYEAPVLDRTGWKMDKRVYDSDEKITFSIPVSDQVSGIASVECNVTIGEYQPSIEMKYDEKTGLATGVIDNVWKLAGKYLPDDQNSIKGVIHNITAFDGAGNVSNVRLEIPITVNRKEAVVLPFDDISQNDWFAKEVRYVYEKKLMTGLDETTFAPYGILSRAQFAVILYRMAGSPSVVFDEKRFPDVEEGWYSDAVIWANDQEIINGYTHNGCFGPADSITREQMATMMYRYAEKMNYDISASADFSGFEDSYKVSEFAGKAMRWAVGSSIITGKYNGTILDPQGEASRAECAIILQRFLER